MRRKVISTVIAVLGICAAAADMMLLFVGAGASSRSVSSAGAPLGSDASSGSSGTSDSSGADSGDASGDGADAADGAGSADADESSGSSTGDDAATSEGAFKDGTYTGAVVATGKGDVQVQVTVSGGKVTQVAAVKYPSDNPRSIGIAQQAIPQLSDEAVKAQSADIQMVSGATETSTGFIGSLQDALDQAK